MAQQPPGPSGMPSDQERTWALVCTDAPTGSP